jgi:hypothetical protein
MIEFGLFVRDHASLLSYIMLFNQLLHNISTVARKIDLFSAIIHLPHLLLTSN